jgi:hypothetical protein
VTELNASVAALATEVKADIENGFGTWKVKLNVNILPFCVLPREDTGSGKEGKQEGGRLVDGGDNTPVVLIRILKILWSNPAVLPFFDQALSENL